mmetsp:Transcript_30099/g.36770  ORF Transcript_30099/g.36770 Transcript_30099/m.36770 type:complete len:115 (-) Transcript_30099:541-885(-)
MLLKKLSKSTCCSNLSKKINSVGYFSCVALAFPPLTTTVGNELHFEVRCDLYFPHSYRISFGKNCAAPRRVRSSQEQMRLIIQMNFANYLLETLSFCPSDQKHKMDLIYGLVRK